MNDQVDEIKTKIDIVSLIGEKITLKKAGKNFKAPCPFHSEKTPSFNVSPDLQIYKCFGCGESGDCFTFLEKYEGMDFYEALKFLSQKAGVTLKPFNVKGGEIKEKLYQINELATRFYSYVLLNHPEGKRALEYLTQKRGLKIDTIKTFKIGYSPDKPFAIRKYLTVKNEVNLSDIEKAGIIYSRGGSPIDRFRGRVIFPLFDHRDNICGFSGRLTPWMEGKGLAKYINTPETPIYYKSKILFGLNIVKGDIKRNEKVIITEGELDMISSWQAGIKNVVAIKGSALTQEQIKLISRYCQNIILALDSDIAGDAAARRGIEIAQKEGLNIKVAILGNYKDPDDFARADKEGYIKALSEAVGIYDFIIDSIFKKYSDASGSSKALISKTVIPVLSQIPDKIVQAHYIQIVSKKLSIPQEAVFEQLKNYFSGIDTKPTEIITALKPKTTRKEILEARLIAIIFNFQPEMLLESKYTDIFTSPVNQKIYKHFIEFMNKHKKFKLQDFSKYLPEELSESLKNIILEGAEGIDENSEDEYEKEIKIVERELLENKLKLELQELTDKIVELEKKEDRAGLEKLNKKFSTLIKKMKDFEEKNIKGIILEK